MSNKIAIITRTKNRTTLLKRCIETVLNQSYQDWIHVIVNDGGDAQDVEHLVSSYLESYKERIKIVHNPHSLGMEAASNLGIRSSTSEYIVILDDDDSWDEKFLEIMIHSLENREWKDIKGVVSHTKIIYEKIDGQKVVEISRSDFNKWMKSVDLISLFAWNRFTPVSFLFERNALNEIGYFDESLPVCGDWDFNIRFCLQYEILVVPQTLAYWHQRPTQKGIYGNSVHFGKDLHEVYRSRITNHWIRNSIKDGKMSYGEIFILSLVVEFTNKIYSLKTRVKKILFLGFR